MTIFSSVRRTPLEDFIKEVTADYWGHWTSELVRVEEVLNKINKLNMNRPDEKKIDVTFSTDLINHDNSVGWTLKDINKWPQKIDEDKRIGPSGWALTVSDPYSVTYESTARPIKTVNNPIEHPKHYISDRFEVIDIIEDFCKGLEGRAAFDCGNAIKYILRWHNKNGVEDLKKAEWYIQDLIKHLESEEKKDETQNGN